jgi:Tfp pilus assembly protein PilN
MGVRRINLLPPEARAKAKRERGLLWALLGLIIVLGVLGLLYVFERQKVSDRKDQLASQQSQLNQLQQQITVLRPFEVQQSERSQMTEVAKSIWDSRVVWSSIAEEISLLIPEECRLTTFSATVPPPMLAGSALGGAAATGEGATADVSFSGEALSHRDVAEFMTRLGLMPQLKDVTLVSASGPTDTGTTDTGTTTGTTTDSSARLVTFEIVARLRPFQSPAPMAVPEVPEGAQGGGEAAPEPVPTDGGEPQ